MVEFTDRVWSEFLPRLCGKDYKIRCPEFLGIQGFAIIVAVLALRYDLFTKRELALAQLVSLTFHSRDDEPFILDSVTGSERCFLEFQFKCFDLLMSQIESNKSALGAFRKLRTDVDIVLSQLEVTDPSAPNEQPGLG